MNCDIFKKRLDDYVENNMSYDIKNAMEKHIAECSKCRQLYEQEISINNSFEETFKVDGILFHSSRISILNNIDKKRYKKSFANKLYYHTRKYKVQYSACAALVVFMMIFSPFILNKLKPEKNNVDIKKEEIVISNGSKSSTETEKKTIEPDEKAEAKQEKVEKQTSKPKVEKTSYTPQIVKKQENKDVKIQMNTTWKYSPSNKYVATVAGKGEQATEEGIAKMFLKDVKSENIWSFELANNTKQYTPKILEWWDDDNILITIGYGYGSTSPGGNLYLLKPSTNAISEIYKDENEVKYQIVEVRKEESDIHLRVNVFEDDNFTKSHVENWTLKSFDINTLKNKGIVKNK